MEHLPYIDEHRICIAATCEDMWGALMSVLRTQLDGAAAAPLTRMLGLRPPELRGDWYGALRPGDSLPGFQVAESQPPARLALRGAHRFSRYALVFELDAIGAAGCSLSARSWAAFPGLAGRGYRAIVIGTGGHRLVVRRLLHRVARRA
jgi:hypothetical protein